MNNEDRISIQIAPAVYRRLCASLPVVESVLEERSGLGELADLALDRGLSLMLREVIGQGDLDEILLDSIDQMSQESPEFIYAFVANRIRSFVDP